MTDPLALEPILGPQERGRPAFNEDLPHDERFALFEAHVAAGLKVEATGRGAAGQQSREKNASVNPPHDRS